MAGIRVKRVYEEPAASDGFRVLVDRLWPRGLTKAAARIDFWAKDIAPSTELRRWYHANRSAWTEFRTRYLAELKGQHDTLKALLVHAEGRPITLLYGAKDSEHTHASMLKGILERS